DDLETLHPLLAVVEDVIEIVDRCDIGKVPLVVLQNVGDVIKQHVLFGQIVLEVFETLDVLLHFFPLRISDENDAIHAAENELTGGIVNDLTGNRIKLELRDKAFDNQRIEREEIEEHGG